MIDIAVEQAQEARVRANSVATVEAAVVLGEIAPSVDLSAALARLADDIALRCARVALELEAATW